MRVTRLEIFGFKSFRDRFVLNCESDLIGIIGPNGCGKSNIVDALRWGLGETNARNLRGSLQEDLIFSGSASAKQLGMCEVSITFKPDERWKETVLQTMSSELKGEDSGEGDPKESDGVKFVEISEEVSDSEGEDEDKSEPIFSSAQLGLLDCAEVQITRRLYRSGESEYFINKIPCRRRDIAEFCRIVGVGPRGLSIVQQGTVGQIVTMKPVERRQLIEEAAGISGFRTKIEMATRRLNGCEQDISRLNDISLELTTQVKHLKRQANRAKMREELKTELSSREKSYFNGKVATVYLRTDEAEKEIGKYTEEIREVEESIVKLEEKLEQSGAGGGDLEARYEGLKDNQRRISAALNRQKEKEHALNLNLAQVEGRKRHLESDAQRCVDRGEGLQLDIDSSAKKLSEILVRIDELTAESQSAEAQLMQIQSNHSEGHESGSGEISEFSLEISELQARVDKLPELVELVNNLELNRRRVNDEISVMRSELADLNAEHSVASREVESLDSQLKAAATEASNAVISSGDNKKQGDLFGGAVQGESQGAAGVLLSGVSVPAELQKSVAAVLGVRANYLVSTNCWSLLERYKSVQRKKDDRNIGVICADAGSAETENVVLTASDREVFPSAELLIDKLQISSEYKPAVRMLLDAVVLVDTVEEGVALRAVWSEAGKGSRTTIVTISGEVIESWGWFTTGRAGANLSLARRREEQAARVEKLTIELGKRKQELEPVVAQLEVTEKELHFVTSERLSLLKDQEKLSSLFKSMREQEKQQQIAQLELEREGQRKIRLIEKELAGCKGKLDYEQKRASDRKAEVAQLGIREEDCRNSLLTIDAEITELQHAIEQLNSLEFNGESVTRQILQDRIDQLSGQLSVLEAERSKARKEFRENSDSLHKMRSQKDRLAGMHSDVRMKIERAEVELELLGDEFNRVYGEEAELLEREDIESFCETLEVSLSEFVEAAEQDVARLKRRLEREGEVDPSSIERFESEAKRLETLEEQITDLTKGTISLKQTIEHLKAVSKERFNAAYEFVQQKFEELIPRLFGGGLGRMELIDPVDVLTTGIEMVVRPPGKKLKNLELLSGGEKALAATAVLISVFLYRPGPICVLDEVDAPLDEANLGRFIDLIRSIADSTQFIMITHNKLTMASVDRLVGITMQEKGVSTALEVNLEEAEVELKRAVGNA